MSMQPEIKEQALALSDEIDKVITAIQGRIASNEDIRDLAEQLPSLTLRLRATCELLERQSRFEKSDSNK